MKRVPSKVPNPAEPQPESPELHDDDQPEKDDADQEREPLTEGGSEPQNSSHHDEVQPNIWYQILCCVIAFLSGAMIVLQTALSVVLSDCTFSRFS